MNPDNLVAIYVFTDEALGAMGKKKTHKALKVSDSEILFLYIAACLDYHGNYALALRRLCGQGRYVTHPLSRCQFSKRLKELDYKRRQIIELLHLMALVGQTEFIVDSYPAPACHRVRMKRAKIGGNADWGKCAAKDEWYWGQKVHLITTLQGTIVASFFTPANTNDLSAFIEWILSGVCLLEGTLYADKAYNDYLFEDMLRVHFNINLCPLRKKNSRKPDNIRAIQAQRGRSRRHIESTISVIKQRWPAHIHATTPQGRLVKIEGFMLAHNCKKLLSA